MGWEISLVALMALLGGVLGTAGAYAWVNRHPNPTPAPLARRPEQPPEPVSLVKPGTNDPEPKEPVVATQTAVRPAPLAASSTPSPAQPEPTRQLPALPPTSRPLPPPPTATPLAPTARPVPPPMTRALPVRALPVRPLPPRAGRGSAAPLASVPAPRPLDRPVERLAHPSMAPNAAARGRGPTLRAGDQIAVHLPGGGVVRIDSGVIVGRADSCRLRFRASRVSRLHAVIYKTRGSWWLGDMGSTNGTTVDGVPVQGAAPLRLGSYVRIGGRGGVGFTVREAVESADIDSPSAA